MVGINTLSKNVSTELLTIVKKIQNRERINNTEALCLYVDAPIALLGLLANNIRKDLHGERVYFNKNIHIEPTNICVFDCKFCAYSRLLREKEEGCVWFGDDWWRALVLSDKGSLPHVSREV